MRRTTLLAAMLACAAARAETPLAVYSAPSSGFVDDAFAIRDDGRAIAYVITDGATSASLRVAELGGVQSEVTGLPTTVSALYWLGDARLLVVARDPEHQTVTAQVYTPQAAGKEKLGPVDAIALGTVSGKAAVVTWSRVEKRGALDYVLAAYDRATLKPIAKKSLHADPETGIKHPQGPFKPLWWHDGYTMVAALKAGEFDKARDMRRPDRFAQLEPFTGKLSDEHELDDVLAFTRIATDHNAHQGEDAFIHLSEDHRKVLLTDGTNEHELALARPFFLYDPETLAWQTLDANRVALSFTVDPVNPEALKRKKQDPDDLDIYFVDRKSHAATIALKLSGQGRPSAWRIAGGRIGVLRKSKGFDRGGVALEVYELPR